MKFSIIVPAYNEETVITATLEELETYLIQKWGRSFGELIFVNDGSTDKTLNILLDLQKTRTYLKVVDLGTNMGRGMALREGFRHAGGDIIISLDADLSYAPYHIERMVTKMMDEGADIVLASAYGKGGTVQNVPFNRLLISKLGNKVLSFMFDRNITVLTCIVRAYKASLIKTLDLHSNDKDIHLEILYKAKILDKTISEIPADLHWPERKLNGGAKKPKRRSTLKLGKTSSSHFFFALLNRPGLVFLFPGIFLLAFSLAILLIAFNAMIPDINAGMSLYLAIRKSMIETATPSWMTAIFSFLLSIQFNTLGFLTNQNKWNYEENYKTNNAILTELRNRR